MALDISKLAQKLLDELDGAQSLISGKKEGVVLLHNVIMQELAAQAEEGTTNGQSTATSSESVGEAPTAPATSGQ